MAKFKPICKHPDCTTRIEDYTCTSKVFCSPKCREAFKAMLKEIGEVPSQFAMDGIEVLDRHALMDKARMGDKAAMKELNRRWNLTMIWNPLTQKELRLC